MERSIARFTESVDAHPVAQSGFAVWQQGYGTALNAIARSLQGHMTLNLKSYKARIKVSTTSKRKADAIWQALAPDVSLPPSSDARAVVFLKNSEVIFKIETYDIAPMRAAMNSYLRLADASYKCLSL
jgi:tRNA threonylcarbamoyladenosine modification (KEOPS) complex  Pcc1 subunit